MRANKKRYRPMCSNKCNWQFWKTKAGSSRSITGKLRHVFSILGLHLMSGSSWRPHRNVLRETCVQGTILAVQHISYSAILHLLFTWAVHPSIKFCDEQLQNLTNTGQQFFFNLCQDAPVEMLGRVRCWKWLQLPRARPISEVSCFNMTRATVHQKTE